MSNKILKRSEVELEKTWDLTPIYASDEAWEAEFESFTKEIDSITECQDTMLNSVEDLEKTIKLDEALSRKIAKLYVYAHLKSDSDTTDSKYQQYVSKVFSVYPEYTAKSKFIEIKLLELSVEEIEKFFGNDKLGNYKFYIEKLQSSKQHTLSQVEEELIATLSQTSGAASKAFTMLNNADIKFVDAVNEKGESLPMSHSRYISYIDSKDRVLRKSAYDSMYGTYKGLKNTFAATLEGNILNLTTIAKIRKYPSARNYALSQNFIDESVYDALLLAVNDKISNLHKYVEFRKRELGYDELCMYDLHTSLIKSVDLEYTYEEAREIIVDALKVLGEDYVSILNKAFDERWIDYAENEGKRAGAYSSGVYDTRPYILISWRGTLDNVFTLAHELGHSIHSYYTRSTQEYVYGSYPIFLAEVASITNELLLMDYMLKKYENDKEVKAYLLNHYLDKVKGTVYRQTQFAEFEHETHKAVEARIPLTADKLSQMYFDINKKYYGEGIAYDENISYEWARIPHFYTDFYVYQYATGMSAASAFANKILAEGKPAVDKYIGFLKSGNSDYPINTLKKAGVDMSSNEPVYACLETFEEKLDELEKLLG